MLSVRIIAILIWIISCPIAAAQTLPVDAPDSMDQLRKIYEEGRYQEVVKQAAKIFSLRGEAAGEYDRHEVTVLKGESHLRLGQMTLASDAFTTAAAIAPDKSTASVERATALLIQKSNRGIYISVTSSGSATPAQFDVIDPTSRTKALVALYHDERAWAQGAIDAARESDLLPPTLDAIETVLSLQVIEQAANGSQTDTKKLLAPLSKRAGSMMKDEVKAISKRFEQISKSANKKKKVGGSYRKAGLSSRDPQELRDQMQTLGKIVEVCRHLSQILPGETDDFDELRHDAQRKGKRALEVLNDDYSGNFDRP